jgi:NADH dehydrogenase
VRVALFGGTGFVGSYLTDALLSAGHEPVLLVRPGSESRVRRAERCRLVPGDIGDPAAIAATLKNCDAVIWLIGILRERPREGVTFRALQFDAARRVIDAAAAQRVPRFLLMSANGVEAEATPYQRSKIAAERHLAGSGLAGTVFRPSVVFGDPRGRMEFCTRLRDQMIRPPLPAPAFFTGLSPTRGSFSMSPVFVEDVAAAFVRSLEHAGSIGATWELGGPDTLVWPEIIRRIANACGRRKLIVPVPLWPLRLAASVLDRFDFFPVTRDQLTMLAQGNVVSSHAGFETLEITPAPFSGERLAYLQRGR